MLYYTRLSYLALHSVMLTISSENSLQPYVFIIDAGSQDPFYHREGYFKQLNVSYFKFTFGFNFRIVQYMRVQYSIMENFFIWI